MVTLRDAAAYADASVQAGLSYSYRAKLRNAAGTSPTSEPVAAVTAMERVPQPGLRLWLRASAGLLYPSPIFRWQDQSGAGHDALTGSWGRPTFVPGVINGWPVLRFESWMESYFTLPDMMAGATAGDFFVVTSMRIEPWYLSYGVMHFGGGAGTGYGNDGSVRDDFGTLADASLPAPANVDLWAPHVLHSSISSEGVSTLSFNGVEHAVRPDQTVFFRPDPVIGGDAFGNGYEGDIAEIIVFDRVLSPAERDQVLQYLGEKYRLPGLHEEEAP